MYGYRSNYNSMANRDLTASDAPITPSSVRINKQNFVCAGSWEGNVCVWKVNSGNIQNVRKSNFNVPVLDVAWSSNNIVTAGADNLGWIWDVESDKKMGIAKHAAPIRKVSVLSDNPNMVATGSWDTFLKFWDIRTQREALSCALNERIYAMDIKSNVIAVGTAPKGLAVYDSRKPDSPVKSFDSPLRMQTRCLSVFKNNDGICIGSIEGRIGVLYFNDTTRSFNFKAHRQQLQPKNELAFAINTISFHPIHGTFLTGGSDGNMIVWDKTAKEKRMELTKQTEAIIDSSFNDDGSLLAYAVGYDYSRGKDDKRHDDGKICVKQLSRDEMKEK